MLLEFEISIKPVSQARPRFFVRQNGLKRYVGAYDTKECKTFKEAIAWQAKVKAKECGLKDVLRGAISIGLIFQMGENGKKAYHTHRPDLDNLIKAVQDALRGVIYADDSQIVELSAVKRFGRPTVALRVEALE